MARPHQPVHIDPRTMTSHQIPVTDTNESRKVRFTPDQLSFLEKHFPEQVFTHQTTEAQMRHYHGQRNVIDTVRRCTSA